MEKITVKKNFVNNSVSVIGVSVKEGQQLTGVEKAPQLFREAGLLKCIHEIGLSITDHGNITTESIEAEIQNEMLNTKEYEFLVENGDVLGPMNKRLHDLAFSAASNKDTVLVLGGDHGLATGSISGVKKAYPDLKVIWVDAHGDCNTPETSPSGNYHGMPVAHLLGWMKKGAIKGFDWFEPCLKGEDIVYIGLRDIDPEERKLLRDHNIKVFTPFDIIDLGGIHSVMKEVFSYLGMDENKNIPIHVSWDIDGCDPSFIEATGTKSRCGISEREAHYILQKIAATGNLVSIDMVEVNPELEPNDEHREVLHGDIAFLKGTPTLLYASEFILSALGNRWL